jgi:ATP synthase protein I
MDDKQPGEGEDAGTSYRRAGPYIDASWQLVGSLGLWTLVGWFLDKKLGSGPWLLVAGSLLGMGLGFYLFFRVIADIGKRKMK